MLLSVGKDMFGKHNNFLNDIIIRYNNRFGHTIYIWGRAKQKIPYWFLKK